MSITDQVLSALLLYGLPVLFGVILICSVGIPFPVSLMLVAAGSFVQQGDMKLWQGVVVAGVSAVAGRHGAYFFCLWGGRGLILWGFHSIALLTQLKPPQTPPPPLTPPRHLL